jgi:rhodanese-related sulfurtransferase
MEFVQANLVWVAVAVISGAMLIASFVRGGGGGISVTEATLLINREDALVLDVRETSEWSSGHIPNARHVALGQLEKHMSELEKFKGKPIIVCCASGNRSSSACATLKKAGFDRVFSLNDGIGGWKGAGLPVTAKG